MLSMFTPFFSPGNQEKGCRHPCGVNAIDETTVKNNKSRLLKGPNATLLKSVRVHFAYGSDGRIFYVEYS